ncbi:MAG: metallophosphoesterase, partial [Vampirovibrio sp.]|nr:metallophosphoesterase [Vampirovibrio sp.]
HTGEHHQQKARQPGSRLLKAYLVSDVHLNDHPFDHEMFHENPRRRHFRDFLSQLRQDMADPSVQIRLILNGDIIDITGSWFEPFMPWEVEDAKTEEALRELLKRILENNAAIFDEMRQVLATPQGQVNYVIGNHDHMLQLFPAMQDYLREQLCPEHPERLTFCDELIVPELGLYVAHGHNFDPFNRANDHIKHPLGDYINMLLINRFVEKVVNSLADYGYSSLVIQELRLQLHDIEYLRPLSLIPLWIESVASRYRKHIENKGKEKPINEIILSVVAEVLDKNTTRPLLEKLNFPREFMTSLVHWWVHLPGSLPIVSFLVSFIARRSHSNKHQLEQAKKLHKEWGYKFIAFGHTHAPSVTPLSESGYYFNTGSWKPVINLFKQLPLEQSNLEYLTPKVQFNKLEYSGVLGFETALDNPSARPRFWLQTIQSGLVG